MFTNRFVFALWMILLGLSVAGVWAWVMPKTTAVAAPQAITNHLWGVVTDASGNPLAGVSPTVSGATAVINPSNVSGFYSLNVPTNVLTYTVYWDIPGYGSLPPTVIDNTIAHYKPFNIVLPPANNIVQNPDFENNLNNWQTSGGNLPTLQNQANHTGEQGVLFGTQKLIDDLESLIPESSSPPIVDMIEDNTHTFHLMSYESTTAPSKKIVYHQRTPDGVWQTPIPVWEITDPQNYINEIRVGVDNTGTLHVVWMMTLDLKIYYQQRHPDGTWSTPEVVATAPSGSPAQANMITSPDGVVVVTWSEPNVGIRYMQRATDGVWSNVETLPLAPGFLRIDEQEMAFDSTGGVYLLAGENNNTTLSVYMYYRANSGTWSSPQLVSQANELSINLTIAVDPNDTLHVMWLQLTLINGASYDLFYRQFKNGVWSISELVQPTISGSLFSFAVGGDGRVYVIFAKDFGTGYQERSVAGVWSDLAWIDVDKELVGTLEPNLQLASDDTLYVCWYEYPYINNSPTIAYRQKNAAGVWGNVYEFPHTTSPILLYSLDMRLIAERPVLFWTNVDSTHQYTLYTNGPELSDQSIDDTLSQVVSIPMTMTTPNLSWVYQLIYASADHEVGGTLIIDNGNSTTAVWSVLSDRTDWTHASVDLTPWVGQTVTLTFKVHETAGEFRPRFLLDEVTLGSVLPDVAVNLAETMALPGETAVYHLQYGNRGGSPALTNTLTFTLPSEIAFVSASITPTMVLSDSVLVWELGNLPGKAWQTLTVSGTVTGTAVFGDIYNHTLTMGTASTESQTLNNRLTNYTVMGYRQFLSFMKP